MIQEIQLINDVEVNRKNHPVVKVVLNHLDINFFLKINRKSINSYQLTDPRIPGIL